MGDMQLGYDPKNDEFIILDLETKGEIRIPFKILRKNMDEFEIIRYINGLRS